MAISKATHHQTRVHNERFVLATVFDGGPTSRAEVARATGLTRPTVSNVMSALIDRGLVREIGTGPSTGGKAPTLLEVPADARQMAVVAVSDSAFRGAIVDLRGQIVSHVEVPIDGLDGDEALEELLELVDRVVAMADRPLIGVGIGTPGLADTTSGTVRAAVNIDWSDVPLGTLLEGRHGLPALVVNDGQATALAEHVFGGPRTANLLVVKVGRGVGAGIILDGLLYQGDGFGAGEIGHTVLVENGRPCRCGKRGCLETLASTRAILDRIAEADQHRVTERSLSDVAAALDDDPAVRGPVLEAAGHLGSALASWVGALNIHRIVLTGPATVFGEPWRRAVQDKMRARALGLLAQRTTIELGHLGDDGVLLGASALLLTRVLGLRLPSASEDDPQPSELVPPGVMSGPTT